MVLTTVVGTAPLGSQGPQSLPRCRETAPKALQTVGLIINLYAGCTGLLFDGKGTCEDFPEPMMKHDKTFFYI